MQTVQAISQEAECSPSHSKCKTYFCVRTAGVHLIFDRLLQQKGGRKWVGTSSKIIGVGVLCGSALALPEHTLVSGRLKGGSGPAGNVAQVAREAANPHA